MLWWYRNSGPDVAVETPNGYVYTGYTISPQKSYSMEARVLLRKNYYAGREADLSPVDLALGWGPMTDDAVIDELEIWQSNRFYWWRAREFPIPRRDIERNSANVHIIPATPEVAKTLKRVRKDMHVRLEGQLVNVDADDGWRWKTSLSFNDTGAGACELLWLEHIELL